MKKGKIGTPASGGAILVQIVGIMEIGNSAFTLSNVRQARLDKADMTGLTRDREEPGEGEEGAVGRRNDAEDEEDATMPPYPRSMLTLLLSDGTATIKAMEVKRLPNIILGETPLGFKLLLKGVPVRNGIAMLEPDNVELLGYLNDELQSHADFQFMNALRKRMGKPELEPDEEQEQEMRNPVVEAPVPAPSPPPRQAPRVTREEPDVDDWAYFDEFTPPPEDMLDVRVAPPPAAAAPAPPAAGTIPARGPPQDQPMRKSVPSESNEIFGDDISMEVDDEFWKEIDEIEGAALSGGLKAASSAPAATNTGKSTQSGGGGVVSEASGTKAAPIDIIELDDSDEEEETNNAPAYPASQKRPRVVDTIDLSD
ncbi:hypothetical protein M408DRAFT_333009 [Serendipita vermifera MAFF 305830]|uniref:RecQ-mediated genome instability protein 1 n=1 Tax=Serendipita vermifera MAFF 305830 TaxID=933852 RepID=A0A0C3AC61_SERVB|nr:hypothetical protein M408DRAFT_333009 [Serendipita vermifera MAFF 305830]